MSEVLIGRFRLLVDRMKRSFGLKLLLRGQLRRLDGDLPGLAGACWSLGGIGLERAVKNGMIFLASRAGQITDLPD